MVHFARVRGGVRWGFVEGEGVAVAERQLVALLLCPALNVVSAY